MTETAPPRHFIQRRIEEDLARNTYQGKVLTRFPPEPNGYLHIGHVKAICLSFSMADQYNGQCILRFDDTNPIKEEQEYVDAIQEDVHWLGFQWCQLTYTSDQFERLYQLAIELIKQGLAYVCSLSADEIRHYRGTLEQPGTDSPFRNRTIDENLDLFSRMQQGEFTEGQHVLRAKIDMTAGNINLRDPVIYRILHAHHHRTGDRWHIYPMYDFSHGLTDALEGITHSLCTLEFQDHRPLYDWFNQQLLPEPLPQQIEFSRLNITHTVMSKRKLKLLVDEQHVAGWNDPRMPTISGLRRRGFTAAALRKFCNMIGISKSDSIIDMSVLEECVRTDLNETADRAMCVIDPIKVTITNYPADQTEQLTAPNHPQQTERGQRELPFTRELYIERNDFMEDPPSKFHRLKPGGEVKLRYAYVIKCIDVIKNQAGDIVELRCEYDPDTLGKKPEGRKVKGIIHWVSATQHHAATVRTYDRLFQVENPTASDDWQATLNDLNPKSLQVHHNCYVEPALKQAQNEQRFQFERLGYFVVDRYDSSAEHLIFNRIVALRDTWQK